MSESGVLRAGWVQDARLNLPVSILVWVLLLFMTVPEGFVYSDRGDLKTSGSVVSQLTWLALLGGSAAILAWRARLSLLMLRRLNPFMTAFVVLVALSALWSFDPGVTIRRELRVVTMVLVPLAMTVVCWNPWRLQQLMRTWLTAMLLASLVFGIVSPKLAIEQSTSHELAGAWHGLAMQKNGFGALSSLAAIFWFHAGLTLQVRRWMAMGGTLLALLCLALSRSSTSLMATVFVMGFLLLTLRAPANLRRWMPIIVAVFVGLVLTYSLAVLQLVPGLDIVLEPITALTGKDLTFSGRTEIWKIINAHIAEHPWLGTGYGAYWTGPVPSSPSYIFLSALYFYPTESHNGYLEVINDLGVVGGLCLLGYLVVYTRQSLELMHLERSQSLLYLALFFQQLITNLSESHWFNSLSVDFVVEALATAALARSLLDHDLRRWFGEPRLSAAAVDLLPAASVRDAARLQAGTPGASA